MPCLELGSDPLSTQPPLLIPPNQRTLNQLPFSSIVFTGSCMVGRFVMKDASRNLSKLVLELGGSNPTIVHKTADIPLTAKRIANAKFSNCGQTCITVNHIHVHSSIKDKFLQSLKEELIRMYGTNAQESSDYSRVISYRHTKRIIKSLEGLQENVYYQCGDVDLEDKFIPPTIMTDLEEDSHLVVEEIFGPVLPVLAYDDIDAVIARINDSPKSLNINYYGDIKQNDYKKLKYETSSGAILTNDHLLNYVAVTTGFGGVGMSGFGRIRGFEGFKELSNCKSIIGRLTLMFHSYIA